MSEINKENQENQESYLAQYQVLENVVSQLSQQQQIDIDQLLPLVDQASYAYKICKSRIEAVEAALNERFESEDTEQ